MLVQPPMKIVIPGGSGQVGTILARAFHRDGHEVVVLSRSPGAAPWRFSIDAARFWERASTRLRPRAWPEAARDLCAAWRRGREERPAG